MFEDLAFEFKLRDVYNRGGEPVHTIRGSFTDDCTGIYIEFPGADFTAKGDAPIFITCPDGIPKVYVWDITPPRPCLKVFSGPIKAKLPTPQELDDLESQFRNLNEWANNKVKLIHPVSVCWSMYYPLKLNDYCYIELSDIEFYYQPPTDKEEYLVIELFETVEKYNDEAFLRHIVEQTDAFDTFKERVNTLHNLGKQLTNKYPGFDYIMHLHELAQTLNR